MNKTKFLIARDTGEEFVPIGLSDELPFDDSIGWRMGVCQYGGVVTACLFCQEDQIMIFGALSVLLYEGDVIVPCGVNVGDSEYPEEYEIFDQETSEQIFFEVCP